MKPGGLLGNIAGGAVLLAFFHGLMLLAFVPFEMKKLADARQWPSRAGIITQSSASPVYRKRGWRPRWSYVIHGTFADNGEPFVITRVRYGDLIGGGKTKSREVVSRYPAGSTVQVFYSPQRPRTLILEPQAPADELRRALGLGVVLALLPVLLYAGGRLKKALTAAARGDGRAQRGGVESGDDHLG